MRSKEPFLRVRVARLAAGVTLMPSVQSPIFPEAAGAIYTGEDPLSRTVAYTVPLRFLIMQVLYQLDIVIVCEQTKNEYPLWQIFDDMTSQANLKPFFKDHPTGQVKHL
jgi:hypothetical protein